jgi:hypothetical protein
MRAANHRQSGTCGKRARNSPSPAADSDFTDDPTVTASGSCQLGLRAAAGHRRVQVLHSSFAVSGSLPSPSPGRPQALESTLSRPITGIFYRGYSLYYSATPKLAALGAGRGHPGPRPRPRPPGDGDGTPVPDLPGDGDGAPSPTVPDLPGTGTLQRHGRSPILPESECPRSPVPVPICRGRGRSGSPVPASDRGARAMPRSRGHRASAAVGLGLGLSLLVGALAPSNLPAAGGPGDLSLLWNLGLINE